MEENKNNEKIRAYLLSKNLPIDLLVEVQDHLLSQIDELQKGNMNFVEAFKTVKNSWFTELRFSKYKIQFDLNDRTYFEKKIKEELQIGILKKSFAVTFMLAIFVIISAQILSADYFNYVFLTMLMLVIATPLFQYFKNKKVFKLAKNYDNYKLTLSQDATTISLITLGSTSTVFYNIFIHTDDIYETIKYWQLDLGLVTLILIVFLVMLNAYCFFAQRDYLEQMKKVQPYLKYLKPS